MSRYSKVEQASRVGQAREGRRIRFAMISSVNESSCLALIAVKGNHRYRSIWKSCRENDNI